ncbi:MAG: nuclear transport factor 2 family protein [Actinomycetota bacterium]
MADRELDREDVTALLGRIATAWADCDADAAAACFTEDAVYMEPPDRQLFVGRPQLRDYFSPLRPGTYLEIHHVWFDASAQTGVFEFTFGMEARDEADHGTVVFRIDDRRIGSWREYQRRGPTPFERFVASDGKAWDWHAGNYP